MNYSGEFQESLPFYPIQKSIYDLKYVKNWGAVFHSHPTSWVFNMSNFDNWFYFIRRGH